MSSQAEVEQELARLKGGALPAAEQPQAIEAPEEGEILDAEPEKSTTETSKDAR